ncbi:hypothetical protein [Burkholderia stagnalis]|uniref:hypothetical protein n=1 Tax=Burkholderia stagnalis TaxID=1503054 RepID=UPI000A5D884C|nr:hypothetical protein [Burkholderia stagnalis]
MDMSFETRRWNASQTAGGSIARVSDVVLISAGALVAALVLPATGSDQSSELAIVALSATFALVLFPAFGVCQAPLGRTKFRTAILTVLAWLKPGGKTP